MEIKEMMKANQEFEEKEKTFQEKVEMKSSTIE